MLSIFARVSTVGLILSPAILCIVKPPNTNVGAPDLSNGGDKLAGMFVLELNIV